MHTCSAYLRQHINVYQWQNYVHRYVKVLASSKHNFYPQSARESTQIALHYNNFVLSKIKIMYAFHLITQVDTSRSVIH